MSAKMGRPKKAKNLKRNHTIMTTFSAEGKAAVFAAAKAAGLPVSHWIEAQAFGKDDGK